MPGRDLVVRQEEEVGGRGLHDLPQEVPRSRRGDGDHRRFGRAYAAHHAVQNAAHGLRRQRQVAVLLAVLHRRFDGLLDRGIDEPGRQIAGAVQIGLHHRAPDGLPHVFGQQRRVARRRRGLSQRLQDGWPRRVWKPAPAAGSATPSARWPGAAAWGPGPRRLSGFPRPRGPAAAWRPGARKARGRGAGSLRPGAFPARLPRPRRCTRRRGRAPPARSESTAPAFRRPAPGWAGLPERLLPRPRESPARIPAATRSGQPPRL